MATLRDDAKLFGVVEKVSVTVFMSGDGHCNDR